MIVNGRYGPRLDSPYATTYFPQAVDGAAAQVIELGEGEVKAGLTLVVSPIPETVLSGPESAIITQSL